jgi:hypothetical protein
VCSYTVLTATWQLATKGDDNWVNLEAEFDGLAKGMERLLDVNWEDVVDVIYEPIGQICQVKQFDYEAGNLTVKLSHCESVISARASFNTRHFLEDANKDEVYLTVNELRLNKEGEAIPTKPRDPNNPNSEQEENGWAYVSEDTLESEDDGNRENVIKIISIAVTVTVTITVSSSPFLMSIFANFLQMMDIISSFRLINVRYPIILEKAFDFLLKVFTYFEYALLKLFWNCEENDFCLWFLRNFHESHS